MMKFGWAPASLGIVLAAACSTTSPQPTPYAIDITIDVEQPEAIRIDITFVGDATGITALQLSKDFGFTKPHAGWFSEYELDCPSRECLFLESSSPLTLGVSHAPGEEVTLSYTVKSPAPPLSDVNDYRPSGSFDGVAFYSGITLWLPTAVDQQETILLSHRWQGAREEWYHFGPIGAGDERQAGKVRGLAVRELLFAAGPSAAWRTLGEGAQIGALALSQGALDPDQAIQAVTPVIETTRSFFPPMNENWYFMTASQAGPEIENGFSIGGTAVRSAFALYLSPGLSLGDVDRVLSEVIAHEYFHNWNGVLFYLDEEGVPHSTRWFVEGFTDYYARVMSLRSGMISPEGFAQSLNETIAGYETSPDRDLDNEAVRALWVDNDDRSNISYKRGDLIALLIDESVRTQTNGAVSLDDLMVTLATRALAGQDRPKADEVFAWLAEKGSPQIALEIQRLLSEGGRIPLPNHVHQSGVQLRLDADAQQYVVVGLAP